MTGTLDQFGKVVERSLLGLSLCQIDFIDWGIWALSC